MKKHYNHQDSFMKTRIFQPTCTLVVLFILTNTFLSAQVLDFDPTLEGPWSDVEATTLAVPEVANGSVKLDGKASSGEYGGFEGITVTPGDNAWILDFPGDRTWDGPEDSSFTFWLAQDQDHFYVGVAVKDDVVNSDDPNAAFWKDDSIEIVVDALNDRYDNNTDNSNDPYGGHCYFNFRGRFSIWDDDNNTKTSERWSSAVEWTYGEEGDVYGVGSEVEGGWQLEVRFRKSQFEDPEAGNLLSNGYKMGFNIGLDDDDKQGPGTNGSGDRTQDLELQYWWANRARLQGWTAEEADNFWPEEIARGDHLDYYDLVINSPGRLSHGGTGEIVFGAPPDISPFDETKSQIALPLAEPPTIDGIIDINGGESWAWAGGAAGTFWRVEPDENLADGIRGGSIGDSGEVPVDNQDLSFLIFAGYDADNLYVAIRVQDDILSEDSAEAESYNGNTWHDDSVEVFVDGDNSNFPTRSGNDPNVIDTGGQFVITVNNAYRENEAGNPGYGEGEAWFAQTSVTDTGYDAEFRISLDIIGNPKPGDVIGFTVGVNDDDDDGPAERQVIWVGKPHTEITYGNLLLQGRSYTAPKTDAPKIDGTINYEEYEGAERIYINPHNGVYDIPSGDDTWAWNDHSFFAWVTHDDEAVYVAVDVRDDKIVTDSAEAGSEDGQTWVDDSVEIFFDVDDSNDAGRGVQGFEGQYVITANGAWRDNEANNPQFGEADDWFGASSLTDGGYQIEFKVKKSALSDPAQGANLGFNIAINDDDGGGGRKAQLNWSGRPHSEFTYGSLILGESIGGGPSLFFYQYAEGSSYNKFLEIRNPTDSEVDLSGYAFPNQNNGVDDVESFDYWNSFPEGATIAAGGKYIIAHPDADPAIVAVADHLHKYLSNGDDAYALVQGTREDHVVIDVIGDINGPDPGSGWEVAGISSGTKDHTLVRKSTISGGNPDWAASAGTNTEDSEWIVLDKDVWQLGESKPTISLVNNGDGTVTVTFEGRLQTAPTVNGPWQDVDAESPLILQPDQPATFGRAVSE